MQVHYKIFKFNIQFFIQLTYVKHVAIELGPYTNTYFSSMCTNPHQIKSTQHAQFTQCTLYVVGLLRWVRS